MSEVRFPVPQLREAESQLRTVADAVDDLDVDGRGDLGPPRVVSAVANVSGGWSRWRADLTDDVEMLAAFCDGAAEAATALDGTTVTGRS